MCTACISIHSVKTVLLYISKYSVKTVNIWPQKHLQHYLVCQGWPSIKISAASLAWVEQYTLDKPVTPPRFMSKTLKPHLPLLICIYHSNRQMMDGYSIKFSHYIVSQDKSILAKRLRHMKQIITKVTEAGHHPNNMNRDEGFCFSNSWKPTMYTLGFKEGNLRWLSSLESWSLLVLTRASAPSIIQPSSPQYNSCHCFLYNSHLICSSEM